MHKLVRSIRFSINPFLPGDSVGFNSYSSKPAGEGLAIFFELCVGLVGEVDPESGFVINVTDIDKAVRKYVVPIFAERIRGKYRQGEHIQFVEIVNLLKAGYNQLKDKFGRVMVAELSLKLNPFRKLSVDCEDWKMAYFSEKFDFAAMHKLWNEAFSQEKNFEVFGKCANPSGHGHNYIVEVTVKTSGEDSGFSIADFEKVVDQGFIKLVDHKNLNTDVERFRQTNPTVENLAVLAWDRLADKFSDVKLHCVTIWETDKTCCSYYG